MPISEPEQYVKQDIAYLDAILLDGNGFIKKLPASEVQKYPFIHLRQWAHERARYQIVTAELLDWLSAQISGKTSVEVAAGMGDLGHHLGILMTDSYSQVSSLDVVLYYAMVGAARTEPPECVSKINANTIAREMRPDVIVASWLTQLYQDGDSEAHIGSSIYGCDELELISHTKTYIHIGNRDVHSDKRALALPHEEYAFPWLVSRAKNQSQNVIYVWRN